MPPALSSGATRESHDTDLTLDKDGKVVVMSPLSGNDVISMHYFTG
jgi:hypothetical protein